MRTSVCFRLEVVWVGHALIQCSHIVNMIISILCAEVIHCTSASLFVNSECMYILLFKESHDFFSCVYSVYVHTYVLRTCVRMYMLASCV